MHVKSILAAIAAAVGVGMIVLAPDASGQVRGACTSDFPANCFYPLTGQPRETGDGYCALSVTTAVLLSTCSGGIPTASTWASIANEGGAFRYRVDGGTATTTVGLPVPAGTAAAPTYVRITASLSSVSLVAQDVGTAATLKIAFVH